MLLVLWDFDMKYSAVLKVKVEEKIIQIEKN